MDRTKLHLSIVNNSQLSFARSGGAGGQNVNKVNTKVHLTLPLEKLDGVNEADISLIRQKLKKNINSEDQLFIDCDEERFQERNRELALARLENKIVVATHTRKKRKPTKPTKASKEKRLHLKKIRSQIKKSRNKDFS